MTKTKAENVSDSCLSCYFHTEYSGKAKETTSSIIE